MLPNARTSLEAAGFPPKEAAWILIGCFLGGVVGIQIISRVLHSFMASHVVDCEHSHDEDESPEEDDHDHAHKHDHEHEHVQPPVAARPQRSRTSSLPGHMLRPDDGGNGRRSSGRRTSYFGNQAPQDSAAGEVGTQNPTQRPQTLKSRPTLQARLKTGLSQMVKGPADEPGCDGQCYGYSEPCGQECFRKINKRGGFRVPVPSRTASSTNAARPMMRKSQTAVGGGLTTESTPLLLGNVDEEAQNAQHQNHDHDAPPPPTNTSSSSLHKTNSHTSTISSHSTQPGKPGHHHHVPTNAFLSLGLQTSIAIALHKLPEGFITYATNHANPKLGFAVFLALFIHNITEGFALALPLYLALNNRVTAMSASFVLGGLTQPLGAGIAALWFWGAGDGDWKPEDGVYGAMFAVTAGLMAMVSLQLFGESLDLTHSRKLCFISAFVGMGILGASSALTA